MGQSFLTVCVNFENREKCIISRLTLESGINVGATFIIFEKNKKEKNVYLFLT